MHTTENKMGMKICKQPYDTIQSITDAAIKQINLDKDTLACAFIAAALQ